jgi:hypothetical protein
MNAPLPSRILRDFRRFPWYLGLPLGMIIVFTPHPEWHGDLTNFRDAAETLWHPYWARWIFSLLALPPEPVAYVILSLTSIALLYLAVRAFGGRPWLVFTSYAFAWTLFYGQIDSLVVGGLALAWWALGHERPTLLGAGLILALVKPQLSAPLALALWWWSPSRLRSLLVPAFIFALSLLMWGWWLPEWLAGFGTAGWLVGLSRNLSWWSLIGPFALLIWPLVLTLPMERPRRLAAIAAATAFSVPYFPLPSAVLLLALPAPVWVWAVLQVPLLGPLVGYWVYRLALVVTPGLLLWSVWPGVKSLADNLTLRPTE